MAGRELEEEFLEKIDDIERNAHIKLFHSFMEQWEEEKPGSYEKEKKELEAAFQQFMNILWQVRRIKKRRITLKEIHKGLPQNRWVRLLYEILSDQQRKDKQFDCEAIARGVLQHKVREH